MGGRGEAVAVRVRAGAGAGAVGGPCRGADRGRTALARRARADAGVLSGRSTKVYFLRLATRRHRHVFGGHQEPVRHAG